MLLRFHRSMEYSLTIVFFYEYARGCYALNGHVTLSGLAYSVLPASHITCHRLVYSYVPVPVLHVSSYLYRCTDMDSRLVSSYLFASRFPFCVVDLYTYVFSLMSFSFRLVDSSMLTFTAYAFPLAVCRLVFRLVIYGL